MKPQQLIFTTVIFPRKSSETNTLLLVESIRSFAGTLSENPIWIFTPDSPQQVSTVTKNRLQALDTQLISFAPDESKLPFFFASELQAIAFAESMAKTDTALLAWLDSNTLILNEQVPEERVFPMKTHVDNTTVRPYFNAGILITRPTNLLFRTWHDTFFGIYRNQKKSSKNFLQLTIIHSISFQRMSPVLDHPR
jgi:hypothetical protein